MANRGLVNVGNSCFINAGLQAMLATPTLRGELVPGASDMDRALTELYRSLQTSEQAVKPRKILERAAGRRG